MNRGIVNNGRAAATAGLNRSVWPTAKIRVSLVGELHELVGLGHRPRQRLFNQHRHAGFEEWTRHGGVRRSRCGDHHAVYAAYQFGGVTNHRGLVGFGDLLGTVGIDVYDAGEFDIRHRRQNSRVMPAEVSDADYCKFCHYAHREAEAPPAQSRNPSANLRPRPGVRRW